MVALVTILAVVVTLLALLVAGLLRSHAEIIRALHELGADLDPDSTEPPRVSRQVPRVPRRDDRRATDIVGQTPDGDAASIGVVGATQHTLLAFLTSGCSTCAGFWDAFGDPELEIPGDARLVVITKAGARESQSQLRQVAPPGVTVVMSNDAWEDYEVPVAPYFLFVDATSGTVVGEGAATTWDHVVSLLTRAIDDAGIEPGAGKRGRRHRRSSAEREARIDRELLAAGLRPGDPAFYPSRQARAEHEQAGIAPDEETP